MAEPLSIASGITGLVALSATVLAAGYKYVNSVSSAPEDFKSLIRETASLSAILSQLISHSLSEQTVQQIGSYRPIQQDVLQDCEETLRNIQSLIRDCELSGRRSGKNAINTLLWPLKKREIVKNHERLGRLCANLHAAVSIGSASTIRTLESEQKWGNEVILRLTQNVDETQEQKILDWLSSLDHTVKHTTTMLLKQPGTHEWFLKEQTVLAWLNHGKLFWLQGASGTGKTVLISSVINHIISSPQDQTSSKALAYHYCEFSNPPTLDPSKIVGSLVRQLTLQMDNIAPEIQNLYHKCSGQSPQLDMLFELLDHIIKKTFETTYLIIDGLDESPNRQLLLDGMRQLSKASDSTNSLKILLSSRPEYDIRQALSTTPSFSIKPWHVELDIETHVRAELAKMSKLRTLSLSAQESLISDLVKRAGGMFRWIQCQLDILQRIRTPQALNHALQALPAGLDETYDRILSSIDEGDHDYVLRMLHWLVGSERPLSFRELAEAIALNPDKDHLDPAERLIVPEEIFELCGSLIRIEEDQTIVLAHFSVKEYLLSGHLVGKEHRLAKFALQADRSRRHVSMCILSYVLSIGLRVQRLQQDVLDEEEFPLISFLRFAGISYFQDFDAMHLWMMRHFFADKSKDHEWLLLLDYVKPPALQKSNHGVAWFVQRVLQCSLMCFWNGHIIQHNTPAKAKRSNVMSSVKRVANMFLRLQRAWESPENAGDVSRYYGAKFATVSPLCAAAAFNFEHVTRFLLENGALVNGIPSLEFLGNPLLRALLKGNKEIVRTLTEFGANINIRSAREPYSISLVAAAMHSVELVGYLFEEYEIDTNMLDAYGRTVHHWAIHDTVISQNLRPFSARLEAVREREAEFFDASSLYTSILNLLKQMKGPSIACNHYGNGQLSMLLFRAGTNYYDYAAAFAEQGFIRGDTIEHAYRCNLCSPDFGPDIRGPRFVCLDCVCGDFCANCYANWERSNGEMEFCKGHTFYEIPRPCWYQLREGVVMEDGSTLPQVVDYLEERFTVLFESARS